jgi:hypothetical protein
MEIHVSLRLDSSQEVVFGSHDTVEPDTVISQDVWNGKTYWFLLVRLLPRSDRLSSHESPLVVDLLEGLVLEVVDPAKDVYRRYGYYSGCDAYPDDLTYHIFKKGRPKKPAKPWPHPSHIALSTAGGQDEWPEAEAKALASELFHGRLQCTITLI